MDGQVKYGFECKSLEEKGCEVFGPFKGKFSTDEALKEKYKRFVQCVLQHALAEIRKEQPPSTQWSQIDIFFTTPASWDSAKRTATLLIIKCASDKLKPDLVGTSIEVYHHASEGMFSALASKQRILEEQKEQYYLLIDLGGLTVDALIFKRSQIMTFDDTAIEDTGISCSEHIGCTEIETELIKLIAERVQGRDLVKVKTTRPGAS